MGLRGQYFILFLLLTAPLQSYAHVPKRGKVLGTWGPVFYQRQVDTGTGGIENPLRVGFMIAAEGDVDKNGGLEITLGYMQKRYFKKEGDSLLVEDVKRIHTSTGYRHWFTPKHSASLGIFTSYSIGDIDTIEKKFAPGKEHYSTAANKTAEDGIDMTYQHEFFTTKNVAGVVNLSYSYSFSATGNESPYVYGFMLGIKHFIQAREPDGSLISH